MQARKFEDLCTDGFKKAIATNLEIAEEQLVVSYLMLFFFLSKGRFSRLLNCADFVQCDAWNGKRGN